MGETNEDEVDVCIKDLVQQSGTATTEASKTPDNETSSTRSPFMHEEKKNRIFFRDYKLPEKVRNFSCSCVYRIRAFNKGLTSTALYINCLINVWTVWSPLTFGQQYVTYCIQSLPSVSASGLSYKN